MNRRSRRAGLPAAVLAAGALAAVPASATAPAPVVVAGTQVAAAGDGGAAPVRIDAAGARGDGGSLPAAGARGDGGSLAAAEPGSGFPEPPPVDLRRLPADSRPTALTGLRQTRVCADPPAPEAEALPGLLWAQRSMRLPELWQWGRGAHVRIAVIDSGVARHPLLADRLIPGGDYVAGGTGLADCEGHGTAVAGIAAAAADPDTGFAGLAPAAELIAIRQSSATYVTTRTDGTEVPAGDTNTLAKAIVRAVGLGADVINISEVACVPAQRAGVTGAAVQAAVRYAAERDVVIVVAAGNRGAGGAAGGSQCPVDSGTDTVVLPAWYDEDVLAVASMAPDGTASQFGIRAPWIDVAAPGERVVSLAPEGAGLTDKSSGPTQQGALQGTSFAAPVVAGLAALIRARYPELTARQVMDRISATADRREAGRSVATGWGVVNAQEALSRTPAVLPAPSVRDGFRPAGAGLLPAPPRNPDPGAASGAVWGGSLALVAAVAAAAVAVLRSRGRHRADAGTFPHHR